MIFAIGLALALRPYPAFGDETRDGEANSGKYLTLDLGEGVTLKRVLIPAGKFTMGSPETEANRGEDESPRREVTISKPFYMGVCEVTQAHWRAVMGTEPWADKIWGKPGADHAASWISWHEANEFCKKLSKKTGQAVALPTEAPWEHACRAGTETASCFGDDPSKQGEYAWYAKDFYANSGNVDPENTTESKWRAVRGGSWYNDLRGGRWASRSSWTGPDYRHYNYGFRVVVAPRWDGD